MQLLMGVNNPLLVMFCEEYTKAKEKKEGNNKRMHYHHYYRRSGLGLF